MRHIYILLIIIIILLPVLYLTRSRPVAVKTINQKKSGKIAPTAQIPSSIPTEPILVQEQFCVGKKEYTNIDEAFMSPGPICNLNLANQGLTQLFPDIETISNLEVLDLSNNHFHIIPPELYRLNNLKELNMSNVHMHQSPAGISELKNLVRLNLSANGLTELREEISELHNLKYLDLSNNSLTTMYPAVVKLTQLVSLNLRGNPISKPERTKLQQVLPTTNIIF